MTAVAEQRFPRTMRLKRRRLIRPLFERSNPETRSVAAGSIRILYRFVPRNSTGTDTPVQAGFTPGRCRNAVQRNRVRRQMREIYRTHQHILPLWTIPEAQTLTLMVVARGPDRTEGLRTDLVQAMRLLCQTVTKEE